MNISNDLRTYVRQSSILAVYLLKPLHFFQALSLSDSPETGYYSQILFWQNYINH